MADNRLTGPIRIDSDIRQQAGVGGAGGGLTDDGWAQALDSIRGEIGRFGKTVGAWADQSRAKEGQVEGAAAGLDPEFRPTRAATIYGEAFDRAGLATYQSSMKQAIAADFEKLIEQHGSDPNKFTAEADARRGGWLKNAPIEVQPELTLFVDGLRATGIRQAARAQKAQFVAEQSAAAHAEFATETKAAQQQAFALGLDAGADTILADRIGAIGKLMSRRGADGKPLFSPAERVRALERMREEIAEARVVGAFSRLPDLEAKRKAIDTLREDYSQSRGVAAVFTRDQFHRLENELERDFTQARVIQDRQSAIVRRQVGELMTQATRGVIPGNRDMAALETAVNAARDPQLMQDWADANAVFDWMSRAKTLPPDELRRNAEARREDLRTNGSTLRKLALADATDRLLTEMDSQIKRAPLRWARTAGFPVTDLDVSAPDKLAATLATRVPEAEQYAQRFGRTADYLDPDEAQRLSAELARGGAPMLTTLAAIRAGAGDRAEKVLAELKKEHAPALGALGLLYADAGETQAVRDAAAGLGLMRLDNFKRRRPDNQLTTGDIDSATQGALRRAPAQLAPYLVLADAIYEKVAAERRLTAYDGAVYQRAIKAALGETRVGGVTFGGVVSQGWWSPEAVVLPPFVKQSAWQDVLRTITTADLDAAKLARPVGSDGKEISLSRLFSAGTLVQVENGRYAVTLGGVDDRSLYARLSTDRSKPFVVDLRALRPHLRPRRPDLFLPE